MNKSLLKKVAAKPTKTDAKYSYGNDIEFHLLDVKQDKFVSAIEVLKHDKYDPIDLGDGIKCYWDNVLLEVSYPPYYSKEEMFERIETVIQRIQKYIGPNYRIVPKAAHMYDDSELQNENAKIVGCNPNFSAWDESMNQPKEFTTNLRTTGYHCHIGGKNLLDFKGKTDTIKLLDVFLGTSSVLFNDDETEVERRKLYGIPSEFRPCEWGVEYRPLSSGVMRSKETVGLTFDLINYTLGHIENNNANNILEKINVNEVKTAISKCDKKLALSVLEKAGLPKDLMARVTQKYDTSNFYKSWGIKV